MMGGGAAAGQPALRTAGLLAPPNEPRVTLAAPTLSKTAIRVTV